MRKVTFYKYQGAGNDFLIADNLDGAIELSAEDISAMCDRRYGIGADGVMLLGKSGSAAFRTFAAAIVEFFARGWGLNVRKRGTVHCRFCCGYGTCLRE